MPQPMREWFKEHSHLEVELTLTARSSWDHEINSGRITFYYTTVEVTDDEGNDLGRINGGIDGSWWLYHEEYAPEGVWISARDFWDAFVKAAEAGQLRTVHPTE